MVRFCDAAVKAGTYQTPYRRVLALFFPRCAPPRRTVLAGVTLQLARGAALAVLGDAEALLSIILNVAEGCMRGQEVLDAPHLNAVVASFEGMMDSLRRHYYRPESWKENKV